MTQRFTPIVLPALAATLLAGCSLVKLNGKPLGGGASPTPSSDTATAGTATTAPSGEPASGGSVTTTATTARQPWCEDAGYFEASEVTLAELQALATDTRPPHHAAGTFAEVICATRGEATSVRGQSEQLRLAWMQAHRFDDRDFVVLAAAARGGSNSRQDVKELGGPIAETAGGTRWSHTMLDEAPRGGSMVGRFAYVESCLDAVINAESYADKPLLKLILCTREQLDWKQAFAEIDATPGLGDETRFDVRNMVTLTDGVVAKARGVLAQLAKEEPGIGKLIAIADEQWKAWGSPSPARQALITQLEAMEAAANSQKRSAFAGCAATTRKTWAAHVAKATLPKPSVDGSISEFMRAAVPDADSYLAYQAFRLCAGVDEARTPVELLGTAAQQRGPRAATLAAWMSSGVEFDDRRINLAGLLQQFGPTAGVYISNVKAGEIASLTPAGDGVEITFKQVKAKVQRCVEGRQTNRISHIESDGTVRYQTECVRWGMVVEDFTAGPLLIGKTMAEGLRPGWHLIAAEGVPVVATASAEGRPVWVLGATL